MASICEVCRVATCCNMVYASDKCKHEKLLTALRDLGLELQPAAPPMDLVSQCKQHGLEPSRLLAATTTKEFLPLLECIALTELLAPRVRACLLRGAPLPDVNVPLESRPPGVAMAHVSLEADDQESFVPTDDEFVPEW